MRHRRFAPTPTTPRHRAAAYLNDGRSPRRSVTPNGRERAIRAALVATFEVPIGLRMAHQPHCRMTTNHDERPTTNDQRRNQKAARRYLCQEVGSKRYVSCSSPASCPAKRSGDEGISVVVHLRWSVVGGPSSVNTFLPAHKSRGRTARRWRYRPIPRGNGAPRP